MNLTFPQLIRQARKLKGFSIEELSNKVHLSVSFLYKIEQNVMRPSSENVYDLAKALGIDPTMTLMIWLKDSLPEEKAKCVPVLRFPDYEDRLFSLLWDFHASLIDTRIRKMTAVVKVDIKGNISLKRKMEGLSPQKNAKPIAQYSIMEFVPPEVESTYSSSSKLDVEKVPDGLEYEHTIVPHDKFITHILKFPNGWRWNKAKNNSFSITTKSFVRDAYYMDMESAIKEYQKLRIERLPKNDYTYFVQNPIEELEMIIKLPKRYAPPLVEEFAWHGKGKLWEVNNVIDKRVCFSKEVAHDGGSFRLNVKKPLLDFSFALAWQPMEREKYLALL
ncbi:helix-turn-helix domain-containing protein [Acidobacteriota bacterium]